MKKKQTKSVVTVYWQTVLREAVKRGPAQTAVASLLIASAIAFGFYYFIMSDLFTSNTTLAATVVKKEQENARGQLVEKNEPQFQAEFRKLVNVSESAEPLLPQETEIASVLAGVQEIARREGVTLTGLNALKEGQKSPVAEKIYEREIPAQVTGSPAAVVRFFYELARLSRIIVIRDFEMTAMRPNFTQSSFTLVTFNAPPPKEIPALPAFIQSGKPQVAKN